MNCNKVLRRIWFTQTHKIAIIHQAQQECRLSECILRPSEQLQLWAVSMTIFMSRVGCWAKTNVHHELLSTVTFSLIVAAERKQQQQTNSKTFVLCMNGDFLIERKSEKENQVNDLMQMKFQWPSKFKQRKEVKCRFCIRPNYAFHKSISWISIRKMD